eukprot:scaffold3123_cov15-Prasinocladus_malaysianus.AAC.1
MCIRYKRESPAASIWQGHLRAINACGLIYEHKVVLASLDGRVRDILYKVAAHEPECYVDVWGI